VSQAPAYGESDFYALKNADIDVIVDPVTLAGKFDSTFAELTDLNVKDADKVVVEQLKNRDALFSYKTETHSYPFCWRTGTPLIYKAIPTWFVNVEKIRDRMVELNASTHWVPGFIGEKRFSNWLGNARDWAISRNRYWGSCIPVWINVDDPQDQICIGSVEELQEYTGTEVVDLHRHYLDDLLIKVDGKTYKRTPEVLDCWFESGSMPYGQQHYPFENKDEFLNGFPADFIAEGLDQTRGWFYTLTILAVALFDSVAFKNCITTGMILAEDGRKMSKSLKNYPDPEELLSKYGGDSLRAYLINSPVVRGEPLKFSEEGVQLVTRSIILPLWNSFSFFSTYANADDISYEELETAQPIEERALMDQWLISSLQSLIKTVNEKMENYYLYEVIPPLMNFIDELTNWYIRSNRKRFWKEKDSNDIDKINAFKTLHEVLTDFTKAMAPVLPFICEEIYQGLVNNEDASVHYEDYPTANEKLINQELESSVQLAKDIIKTVRNLRVKLKLPNKQPLNSITIISDDVLVHKQLEIIEHLVKNEINVKNIYIDKNVESWINYELKPNFQTLGPKLGKDISKVVSFLSKLDEQEKRDILNKESFSVENLHIDISEIDTNLKAKSKVENFEIVKNFGLLLDTEISPELNRERLSREIVSIIQQKRKSLGLEITDRICVEIFSKSKVIQNSVNDFSEYIKNETLAKDLVFIEKIGKEKILDYDFEFKLKVSTNNP